jgi:hypothetical protein
LLQGISFAGTDSISASVSIWWKLLIGWCILRWELIARYRIVGDHEKGCSKFAGTT